MLFGNRSSSRTPKMRDKKSISQSGTRRRCNSKLASESRLTLHPRSWSFVAKASCDQPFFTRHFLTCGPIKFNAAFVTATTVKESRKNAVLTPPQVISCVLLAQALKIHRLMNLGLWYASAVVKDIQTAYGFVWLCFFGFLAQSFPNFSRALNISTLDCRCPSAVATVQRELDRPNTLLKPLR
jgi:hypothetical protein